MPTTSEHQAAVGPPDQRRFVVLHHHVGPQLGRTARSHYDWMFQIDRALRTWATVPIAAFDRGLAVDAQLLADHRLEYLEHEGAISGNRGWVERVLWGTFELWENEAGRFRGRLGWTDIDAVAHRAWLSIQRNRPDESASAPSWRLRLAPCE